MRPSSVGQSCYYFYIKRKKPIPLNVVGPQVRSLRLQRGWTQDRLAVRLQLLGWETSRESVNRLENQTRRVPDLELFALARILGVRTDDLFPRDTRKRLREFGPEYRVKLSRGQVPPGA
ncbi:MAG TPA: helix-turn-helix transcriptional regulator [Candidatus Binatia bacterium]|jgi:transcriptional regulator with XRE-family HTH domain|nr:helix-turn-helix transcriptional regulator [Candidatus Binatia bacterium]